MNETIYSVMVDPVAFDHKPTDREVAEITARLKFQKTTADVTAEQLRELIVTGHTICYGTFDRCANGEKFGDSKLFLGQRLMAVDVDNTRKDKTPIEWWEFGYLSVPRAIYRCVHGLGCVPVIVYETFSSTAEHTKFRLVIDLGTTLTDYAAAHKVLRRVLSRFPEADLNGKCAKPDGLFHGTSAENGQYWSNLTGWARDLGGAA